MWQSNRGFSDLATVRLADDGKTILWSSSAPVPLRLGINHVRIKALGQSRAATSVNIYYAPKSPLPKTVLKTTTFHGKQITYEVRDGFAIYQDDIILGKAADVAAAAAAGPLAAKSTKGLHSDALTMTPGVAGSGALWPEVSGVVQIPYIITPQSTQNSDNINAAISEANAQLTGVIHWMLASDPLPANYVNFDFNSPNSNGTCEASVGMIGGEQYIGGAINCTTSTIMHEMGHAMGLYHEQSRADRNTYVNYLEQNIDKPNHLNFDIIEDSVGSGLYNYASIMEYGPFTFNKDGVSPVLETIPPGMVLSITTLAQYTTGDLDGIERLYGFTPSAITVDTNPTGLQVIVDSSPTPCTAPCVFTSWTTGSTHTLSIPTANQTLQTLSSTGENYIFGRWNAGLANVQTVTVVNALGDGTPYRPTTFPSITNYLASFIPVHPYSPAIMPSGDATITASPLPNSSLLVNGAPTYLDRQLITLTVNPSSGNNFYDWFPSPFINIYTNPVTVYLTDDLDSTTTSANTVSDAVTTILATSPDLAAGGLAPSSFPGFALNVTDGKGNVTTPSTPRNFDNSIDGAGFASGENLTISTGTTQSPVTTNISYTFGDWTGAGTASGNSLSVTVPAAAGTSTSTANFTPSFRSLIAPAIGTATTCYASQDGNELTVTSSPLGTTQGDNETYGNIDSFFNDGTVTFTAGTSTSGLNFVGWSLDLAAGGTTNPYPYSLTGQVLGTANFNAPGITAPLSITSISTPTFTSGTATLTINGTGFSTVSSGVSFPSLYTYFGPDGGTYRTSTPISSTQLTMDLNAGDIPTAGYYQLTVLNAVTGGCNPSAGAVFPVTNSTGPAVLGITSSHTGNFAQGQQNATYTLLVTNTGNGPTVDPVTVTETIPSGETLVSMSGSSWTCSSNTCTQSAALGAGMSYGAITVTVDVAANATSPQVNTASVFTATGGGASTATATDPTTISSYQPPTIAKAFNPTSITSGGSSTVTLTLTNSNTSALTGGAFTDTLSNMSALGGAVGGTCSGTTPTSLTAGTTALSFSGITIPASGNCTVTFSVTSTTTGPNPNTTSGVSTTQSGPAGTASNTADLTVTALATPTIAKAFSPTSIASGGSSTVTLTLTNSDTFALTGGAFTDTLAKMSAVGGAVGGTCVGTSPSSLTAGATSLSFSAITIPASGNCTVTFSVTSTTTGANPNTTSGVKTTQTPTAGTASNTADLTVTALAAPTIAKAFSPASIPSGGSSTVTLTLTNSNASSLTGGAFTDTLAKMSAVGGAVGGTCTGTTPATLTAGATALSFTAINILASGSCTVTFSVTSTTTGANPNTTSGVKTTQTPTAGTASNTADLTVTALAAPTIAKAFNPTSIESSAPSTVTLTLSNSNASNLTGGAFTDTLSKMSAVGGAVGGTCVGTTPSSLTAGATSLSFTAITIPASGSCTVTFSVTSTTAGSLPNTTSGVKTTQTPTAGAASNTADLTVTVSPTITKAFSSTSIASGGSSTVTLTLKNGNTTALTGGAFTDTLVNMSALGGAVAGTCVGTTPSTLTAGVTALSFTGITIPKSSSCTVTFKVTSTTVGSLPNTTSGVTTTQTPTAGTASNTAILDVGAATIAKAFSPTSIASGGASTVTLTLKNTDTAALTGGAFTDTLAKMSAVGGAVGGTCVGTTPSTLTAGVTALSFTGITIPASSSCTVTFSVTSTTVGSLPNVTSGVKTTQTPTAGAASNTATLDVGAPTIAKAFNPTSIQSGGSSVVTLTLTNANATAMTAGAFTDTLSKMSAVGGAVGGTCEGTTPSSLTAGATSLSFTAITIPPSGSCTVTFSVTSSTAGTLPNTTSGVKTTQTTTAGLASNTADLTVFAAPTITKAFSPTSITSGGSSTVTLTLKNTDTTALTGGAFTDTLVNMSAVGGAVGGTCVGTAPASLTAGVTALSFTGITIPKSSSCTVTFSVTSTTTGANPNTTSGVTTTQTPTAGAVSNTVDLTVET
jgi:hypothetical protein